MPRRKKSRPQVEAEQEDASTNVNVAGAGASALERLPTELLDNICQHALDGVGGKRRLLELRRTSRRMCRVASGVLNRHVALRDVKGIAAFLECFHPTRKSLRRTVDADPTTAARSPLTTMRAADIRSLRFALALDESQYWKSRFSLFRIYETLQLVLPALAALHTFEWTADEPLAQDVLTALDKCPSMQTLVLAESFLPQDDDDDGRRAKDLWCAERYPSSVKHLLLNISVHYAPNAQNAWSEAISKCISPTTLTRLHSLALNVAITSRSPGSSTFYDISALFQHTFPHLRALGIRGVVVEQPDRLKQFFSRHPRLEYLDVRTDKTVARLHGVVSYANWHAALVDALQTATQTPCALPALRGVSVLPDYGLACTHALLDGRRRGISAVALDMSLEDTGTGHQAADVLDRHHAAGGGGARIRRLLLYNMFTHRDANNIGALAKHAPDVEDLAVFSTAVDYHSPTWMGWVAQWPNLRTLTIAFGGYRISRSNETLKMAEFLASLDRVPHLRKLVTYWRDGVHGSRWQTFVATWLRGPSGPYDIEVVLGTRADGIARWPKVWPSDTC